MSDTANMGLTPAEQLRILAEKIQNENPVIQQLRSEISKVIIGQNNMLDRLLIGTAKDGVFASDGKAIRDEPAFAALKGPAVRSITRTPDGSPSTIPSTSSAFWRVRYSAP